VVHKMIGAALAILAYHQTHYTPEPPKK